MVVSEEESKLLELLGSRRLAVSVAWGPEVNAGPPVVVSLLGPSYL